MEKYLKTLADEMNKGRLYYFEIAVRMSKPRKYKVLLSPNNPLVYIDGVLDDADVPETAELHYECPDENWTLPDPVVLAYARQAMIAENGEYLVI